MNWMEQITRFEVLLRQMEAAGRDGKALAPDDAFDRLTEMTLELRRRRNTIYCIGNGASASMASHFSADMAKNGKVHTEVFSDLALITAISNDMSYDEVFAEPLRRRGEPGDMLLAISSSADSSSAGHKKLPSLSLFLKSAKCS